MKKKYDNAYKYIFSNKTIFCQLIKSFVEEDFVKQISVKNLDLLDKSFVTDEFIQRESDIIYRVKLAERDIYIYILLEFQSTVDKTIPVRMLLYLIQFYDFLYRNSQKGKLPSVFPVLIYNGQDDWTIPSNIRDLIDIQIPEKYIPHFEYYKIIEKDIPDEILLKIHNLASAIIYLEKRKDEKGLKEAIDNVINLIKDENIIDLRMFSVWFKRMFSQQAETEEIMKINNIVEVKTMLQAVADKIYERGIEKGIEKKAYNDAQKMIDKGYPAEEIADITGLYLAEIKRLMQK